MSDEFSQIHRLFNNQIYVRVHHLIYVLIYFLELESNSLYVRSWKLELDPFRIVLPVVFFENHQNQSCIIIIISYAFFKK